MKKFITTAFATLIAVCGYSQTYLPLTGGTLSGPLTGTSATFSGDITTPGKLILTNGAYDGTLIFGNNPTWKSGISTRDATNAEMRIWTNNQNAIYFANGFDGSQAGATLPTDGMKFASNNLGIGGFTVNEPIGYKLHVKGTAKFAAAVTGTSATFINNVNVGSTTGNGIFINEANGTIIGNYSSSPWPGQNNLYVQGSSKFIGNMGIGTNNLDPILNLL